jgi:putative nucleotidyltransferase with HDIG domain
VEADQREELAFGVLGGVCLVGLYLNGTGRFEPAAWLFCGAVLAIVDYILFDAGGLHDTGAAAFLIFILCGTLLLGRRALWLTTALALASVLALYLLQLAGAYRPLVPATPRTVVILSILILIFSGLMAAVRNAWDTHLRRLSESYELTLQGWSKALEYRDGETEGHSQRVTQLCVDLARRLGRPADEIAVIQRGALLHDIGKMAIPDRVLYKPGPLDDEERAIMQQHPLLALRMLDGIPYPYGLRGEAIPMAARIFTVVDHWDALRSDRPYRKAWEASRTMTYLRENAGKLYDPRIVAAFLEMIALGNAGR